MSSPGTKRGENARTTFLSFAHELCPVSPCSSRRAVLPLARGGPSG